MNEYGIWHRIFLTTAIVVIFTTIFLKLGFSRADAVPYSASQVIGQVDGTFAPSFTQSSHNSGLNPVNVSANAYGFNNPSEIKIDSVNHRMFVADTGNYRVLVFNLNSQNILEDYQADYVIGRPDFTSYVVPAEPTASTFSPGSIDLDLVNNRLFVVDSGFTLMVTKSGAFQRVLVFDLDNISNGMSASYVIGKNSFIDDSLLADPTQNNITSPLVVKYDSANERLFVSDQSGRVLVFDARANGSGDKAMCGVVSNGIADGMNASCVIAQPDFTSNSEGLVFQPYGMDINPDGFLFLAEPVTSRILVFDVRPEGAGAITKCGITTSGLINDIQPSCVLGQPDFVTFDNGTTANKFLTPSGVTVMNDTHLIITDLSNARVLLFDYSTYVNMPSAYFVLGQADLTSNELLPASANSIVVPIYSGYDALNNRVYVADSSGNRILAYDFVEITTSSNLSSGIEGQAYNSSISSTHSQGTLTYTVSSGNLPSGLSLNVNTGQISGTPSVYGTFSFDVTASDALTLHTFSDTKTFSITLDPAPSVVLIPVDVPAPTPGVVPPVVPQIVPEIVSTVIPQPEIKKSAIINIKKKMEQQIQKINNPLPVPVLVESEHGYVSFVYKNLFYISLYFNIFLIGLLLLSCIVMLHKRFTQKKKALPIVKRVTKKSIKK